MVQQAQHPENRAHVRLDHALRHRGCENRINRVAAFAQHIGTDTRNHRMRGDDHPAAAARLGLATETGALGQGVNLFRSQRHGRPPRSFASHSARL